MGADSAEMLEIDLNPNAVKVHVVMCNQLMILVSSISMILPEIEAARPRCSSGIQALCLLSRAIERSNLLIDYCTNSSKLYLVITGNAIVSRFRKSRQLLQQSLIEIENMVPLTLAIKISHIINELGNAEFVLGCVEGEAGRVILALVQNNSSSLDTMEDQELYALKTTASLVRIHTTRDVLTEKRSIKKLIDKVDDHNSTKWKVLNYLLRLLNKFGTSISSKNDLENEEKSSFSTSNDPISSPHGWRRPVPAGIKHLPPSSSSRSNGEDGSTTSYDSFGCTDSSDVSSIRSLDISDSRDCSHTKNLERCDSASFWSYSTSGEDHTLLSELASMPWESQCKVVEEIHSRVLLSSESRHSISGSDLIHPLLDFLNTARDRHDPFPQASALKLLLALITHNWVEGRRIGCEGIELVASFLDSEFVELALSAIEVLCGYKDCRASVAGSGVLESILKKLNHEVGEVIAGKMVRVVRILSWGCDARLHISEIGFVPILVRLMEHEEEEKEEEDGGGSEIVKDCLVVMRNVSETMKGRECIGETEGCVAAVSRRLESEVEEEEENAVIILLSLCTHESSYCRLVMEEGVIPALVSMSVNGGERGKAAAGELLRILRDIDYSETPPVQSLEEEEEEDDDHDDDEEEKHVVMGEEMVGRVEKIEKKQRKIGFFGRFWWSPKAAVTV